MGIVICMQEDTDENLIKRACNGDSDAFSSLISRHYTMIFKVAYKWCGTQEDAEDIAQEVSIKLAKNLDKFDFKSKFTTWLYRVVMNTAKDCQRKNNRKEGRELPMFEDVSFASEEPTPDQKVAMQEVLQEVHNLSDTLKEAVLLVCWEGLTHKEAADILECKESTVSWRIHEARKQLEPLLKERRVS